MFSDQRTQTFTRHVHTWCSFHRRVLASQVPISTKPSWLPTESAYISTGCAWTPQPNLVGFQKILLGVQPNEYARLLIDSSQISTESASIYLALNRICLASSRIRLDLKPKCPAFNRTWLAFNRICLLSSQFVRILAKIQPKKLGYQPAWLVVEHAWLSVWFSTEHAWLSTEHAWFSTQSAVP